MNVLKQTINRAKQTVDEKLGTAEKTELDPEMQRLISRAEEIKTASEKILTAIEAFLQPDPSQRLLPGMMMDGLNKAESVGQEMGILGTRLSADDNYGKTMLRTSDAFRKLGQADREFLTEANNKFVTPMKRFLNEEMKNLENEKKELNNKRLDMDALKAKASKGSNAALDQELKVSQDAYQSSLEAVKQRLHSVEIKLSELQKYLHGFVEAEVEMHTKKLQVLNDVKMQL